MNDQIALPLAYRAAHGEADFFVSDANREAVRHIGKPSLWPVRACLIIGPEASGKTHLARIFQSMQRGPVDLREDVDRQRDEEALFHAWNRAVAGGPVLLMTARTPPLMWNIRLPDLASRLAATPQVAIRAPDDALLAAMMVKQFRDRGVTVAPSVMNYIMTRIERSFADVAHVVATLDAGALAAGRAITIPLARSLLWPDDPPDVMVSSSNLA